MAGGWRSVEGSRHVTIDVLADALVVDRSTALAALQSFARPGLRYSRQDDLEHIFAALDCSPAWLPWASLLHGQHAIAPCEHGTPDCRRALLHCASVRARSSRRHARADGRSPEHLRRALAPRLSPHARRTISSGRWVAGRTVRDAMAAYRRIVGTTVHQQPWTPQRRQPRPRY